MAPFNPNAVFGVFGTWEASEIEVAGAPLRSAAQQGLEGALIGFRRLTRHDVNELESIENKVAVVNMLQ